MVYLPNNLFYHVVYNSCILKRFIVIIVTKNKQGYPPKSLSTMTAELLSMRGGITMTDKSKKKTDVDKEWILLIEKAFKMGLSISEIKHFIIENKNK